MLKCYNNIFLIDLLLLASICMKKEPSPSVLFFLSLIAQACVTYRPYFLIQTLPSTDILILAEVPP